MMTDMRLKPLLVCVATTCALAAHAANLVNDFTLGLSNPNGQWSYGYTNTVGGAFAAFTEYNSNASWFGWRQNINFGVPAIYKVVGSPVNGVLTGEVALHGGPNNEVGLARWTANASGNFLIQGSFGIGDSHNVDHYVYVNSTVHHQVLNTGAASAFSFSVSLGVGDNVDFMVGTAGDVFFDSTPVEATITAQPVPEPATMALAAAGILLANRRRRTRLHG